VTVRGTDSAGNSSTAAVTFTVDTTLPVAAISMPLNNAFVSTATPSITFTATDTNISTRQCKVDAGVYATCTSPYTTPAMADGAHSVTVRGTDLAGNQGTAVVNLTVDTTNPVAAISSPANGSVSASAQPSIAFTSTDANATTTDCKVDAGAYAGCTSPFVPTAQGDGSHTISVRATDAAGNTNVAAVTVTVDATNPSLAISAPASNLITSNAAPTVLFSVVDTTATAQECKVDGGSYAACSSPFAVPALADGAHSISVRATDAASHQNSVTVSITVDTTLPAVTFSAPAANAYMTDTTPDAGFAVTDATATTTECKVDGGAFASCSSPFTAATLTDGAHSFTVRATDAATNQRTATRNFTIDTTLPVVTITSPLNASTTGNASPDVTFSSSDASAVTTECKVDAGSFASCNSPFATSGLSNAAHTVTVRATDQATNQGSSTTTFTVDTTFPTVAISTPASGSLTNDTTPSVTFSSTGSAPLTANCKVDGGSFAGCSSPFTPAALTDGPHTVTVQITDGLARLTSTSVSLTVDGTVPDVAIASPSVASVLSDSTPNIAFGITDVHSTTDECQVDVGVFAPCTTPFTAPPLSDGAHSVTVRGTDTAGNQNTASVGFVVDTIAPGLAITSPLSAATLAVNTAAVLFTSSDATSLTHECKTDVSSYAPCSSPYTTPVLADGPHTVSVRVIDAASHQ
ncbi:MAG: hypothetical protein JHC87_09195, partial [Thermoleophilaceae bacterium]|nr:hypothetical protein [Thermoleophilaceae bacterium]